VLKKVRGVAVNRIQSFRDLEVWQSAMLVARVAHTLALTFPAVQTFALGAQVRRSATSIPSNVAEGHAHRGTRIYLRHIRIALGSLAELETQLELALQLTLIERTDLDGITSELVRCGQLLHGLQRALVRRLLGAASAVVIVSIASAYLMRLAL
jgi:carbamoyl-phosphate synthase large subunit